MFGLNSARIWGSDLAPEGLGAFHRINPQSGSGPTEGIVAGTRIATKLGWCPVEAIAPGDRVMTFDHGMCPVLAVKHAALWVGQGHCPRNLMPLAVPTGALGNGSPMLLLPEQKLVVESDLAEAVFGDPFALIPAAALAGYRGIDRITPHQKVEVVIVHFAGDEVVYANGAGLIHCASETAGVIDVTGEHMPDYAALPLDMARAVVLAMIEEDSRR